MKVIIVSNRGPFSIETDFDGNLNLKRNIGGLATSLHAYLSKKNVFSTHEIIWMHTSETELADSSIQYLEDQFRVKPIFVEPVAYQSFYNACCNQQLYPSLLNLTEFYVEDTQSFGHYEAVNYLLHNSIIDIYEPGDIIWVHDYHFLLLPKLLRQSLPTVYVTFFLHTPFPTNELFTKNLPADFLREILDSLLHADKIGFQTAEYKNNFISCIHSNLNTITTTGTTNIVSYNGHHTDVVSHPISVDFDYYDKISAETLLTLRHKKTVENNHINKTILSVDRLDPCKGLLNKLDAFELFLTRHPEWASRLSFIFIVAPSREEAACNKKLLTDITRKVNEINDKFGADERPIKFFYRRHTLLELVSYYCITDVLLITSLCDGVNLICKEYIACRLNHDGVVILSERAGASVELRDALLIDPYDITDIADKIKQGLCMSSRDQKEKMYKLRSFLRANDIGKWGNLLLDEYFRRREQMR